LAGGGAAVVENKPPGGIPDAGVAVTGAGGFLEEIAVRGAVKGNGGRAVAGADELVGLLIGQRGVAVLGEVAERVVGEGSIGGGRLHPVEEVIAQLESLAIAADSGGVGGDVAV
jgi:hypothetical protein